MKILARELESFVPRYVICPGAHLKEKDDFILLRVCGGMLIPRASDLVTFIL